MRIAEELYQITAVFLCQTGTNAIIYSIAIKAFNTLDLIWKKHSSINTAPTRFIRKKNKTAGRAEFQNKIKSLQTQLVSILYVQLLILFPLFSLNFSRCRLLLLSKFLLQRPQLLANA